MLEELIEKTGMKWKKDGQEFKAINGNSIGQMKSDRTWWYESYFGIESGFPTLRDAVDAYVKELNLSHAEKEELLKEGLDYYDEAFSYEYYWE